MSARPIAAGTSIPGCQRVAQLARLGGSAQRERLEHPEEAVHPLRVTVARGDLAHRHVQRGRDRTAQRLVRPGLDLAGPPEPLDRRERSALSSTVFPTPRSPVSTSDALGAASGDPLQDDVELRELTVATGQLGRSLTGAGRVRVPDGIHDRTIWRV